ncbi:dienelactone hydrolase family protein [Flavobacterium sp.]|uniref:dienelactone hydrolase family protein n=1 Tax=Flavobacterium sp. TaxID=239 RepID=UPI0035B3BC1D
MKIFKGIFFGAILFSTTLMAQLQPVQYKDGSQILNGLSIKPNKSSAQKPGILVLPAWKGIDAHAKSTAENLSKLGYYAFVADIYGEGNYPQTTADAAKMAGFYKKNTELYHKRIELALAQLIQSGANPDNIAVIGFCFGGTGAIEAARANMNVKGVVSFHGGLGKDANRAVTPITAKVLACHGADDPFVSKEEITAFQQEMRDGKADWEMIYYANAVHSFTDPAAGNDNSKGAAYNEKAAQRSFEHMKLFLNEVLKQ